MCLYFVRKVKQKMVYNDNKIYSLLHELCLLSGLTFGGVCDGKSKYLGQVKCLAGHQDTLAEIGIYCHARFRTVDNLASQTLMQGERVW